MLSRFCKPPAAAAEAIHFGNLVLSVCPWTLFFEWSLFCAHTTSVKKEYVWDKEFPESYLSWTFDRLPTQCFFIVLCLRSFKIARNKKYFYSSCHCVPVSSDMASISCWPEETTHVRDCLAGLISCRAECKFCGGDWLRGRLCVEHILLCWLLTGSPETGIKTC